MPPFGPSATMGSCDALLVPPTMICGIGCEVTIGLPRSVCNPCGCNFSFCTHRSRETLTGCVVASPTFPTLSAAATVTFTGPPPVVASNDASVTAGIVAVEKLGLKLNLFVTNTGVQGLVLPAIEQVPLPVLTPLPLSLAVNESAVFSAPLGPQPRRP